VNLVRERHALEMIVRCLVRSPIHRNSSSRDGAL